MIRLAMVLMLLAGPALACGEDTDCVVGDRIYRIAGAENAPNGALVFAHGYRGKASRVMGNGSLKRLADDLGVALIALQGVEGSWQLPGRPRNRTATGAAEFAYVEAVLDHAARFDLNRDRVVATGFSAGGMLTWNLACQRSGMFAGFVPMSGTFWDPVPETCAGPVANIVHIHGDADRTVPLEGRAIGDGKQGEVLQALAMYSDMGGFGEAEATAVGDMDCKTQRNGAGQVLAICMFEGRHGFGTGRLRAGLEMMGF